MTNYKRHMSLNIQGFLNNHKRKKITIFDDDNGKSISDQEARIYLQECLNKGWKLIPIGGEDICEGFDFFGGGCPGHEIKDKTHGTNV